MKKSKAMRKKENVERIAKENAGKPKRNKPMSERYPFNVIADIRKNEKRIDECNEIIDSLSEEISNLKSSGSRYIDSLSDDHTIPDKYLIGIAVKDESTGMVYTGYFTEGHCGLVSRFKLFDKNLTDGFVDNGWIFHDRKEAAKIAYNAGQCDEHYLKNGLISTGIKKVYSSK